jgi:LacI family transcriptional regulator
MPRHTRAAPAKPPSRRATLKEVAHAAGVSLASASYAVNGTGSLGEATRRHVLEVAARLGYRQNLSARAMRTGKTGAIGLVLPDLTNPFFPTLAQSVIQTARQHAYRVFVTDTEGSSELEAESIELLVRHGVDGIVWFPIRDRDTARESLADVPTVVIDRTIPGLESIQADYAGGGRLAADHLLACGHRSIGVISGPRDVLSMRQRCDAAIERIRARGRLAFDVSNAFALDLEPEVKEAIRSRSATAVFCGADLIALGVIDYARSIRLAVPGQLSVIGFDDIPWAQLSSPRLTTIDMPLGDMAAEAVESVLRRADESRESRRKIVFDTTLVERDSVRRLPARGKQGRG